MIQPSHKIRQLPTHSKVWKLTFAIYKGREMAGSDPLRFGGIANVYFECEPVRAVESEH